MQTQSEEMEKKELIDSINKLDLHSYSNEQLREVLSILWVDKGSRRS